MARSYGRIFTSIWADDDFRALPEPTQRLYFVLLSHPNTTHAGTLPLQVRRWAGLSPSSTPDTVRAALDDLIRKRYVLVDEDTEEVLIRTFICTDEGAKSPNIAKSILTTIRSLESRRLRTFALTEFARFECAKALLSTLNQPLPEPLTEGSHEGLDEPPVVLVVEVEEAKAAKNAAADESFAGFWDRYPRKVDRKRALTAWRNMTSQERSAACAAIPAHVAHWDRSKTALQHIPHPTTWLHAKRWEDDLGSTTPRAERTIVRDGATIAESAL